MQHNPSSKVASQDRIPSFLTCIHAIPDHLRGKLRPYTQKPLL